MTPAERYAQRRATILLKFLDAGTILDVGCGEGHFLKKMKDRGFNVHGCDPNKKRRARAEKRVGHPLTNGTLSDCPKKYYDLMTYFFVLQYIPSIEQELVNASKLLRKNGILALEIINHNSYYYRIAGKTLHNLPKRAFPQLNYIKDTVQKTGFKTLRIYPGTPTEVFTKSSSLLVGLKYIIHSLISFFYPFTNPHNLIVVAKKM